MPTRDRKLDFDNVQEGTVKIIIGNVKVSSGLGLLKSARANITTTGTNLTLEMW